MNDVIIVKKSDIKIQKILNLTTESGKKIKDLKTRNRSHHFYIIYISNSIYYLLYGEKNKHKIAELCAIKNTIHLKHILKSLSTFFPKDIILWSGIIHPENYAIYIENEFNHPYKCHQSPLEYRITNPGIAFMWQKEDYEALDKKSIENTITHLENKDKDKCNIYVKFTKDAVDYLQKIISQDTSDIEVSGSLLIKKVSDVDGKIVYELYSHPKSLKEGEKETVDAVWSRYNFHTHPKKAYANHGVKKGWPSSQDYVGFLDLNNHTIFHTVVTVEGLYIISISQEWKGNIEKIDRNFILTNYNISQKSQHSFQEYVDAINSIKYKKSSTSIFIVKFIPWHKATEIFHVFYEKTDKSCLATDKVFNINTYD